MIEPTAVYLPHDVASFPIRIDKRKFDSGRRPSCSRLNLLHERCEFPQTCICPRVDHCPVSRLFTSSAVVLQSVMATKLQKTPAGFLDRKRKCAACAARCSIPDEATTGSALYLAIDTEEEWTDLHRPCTATVSLDVRVATTAGAL